MLRCFLFSFSTEQSYEILKFNSLKNTKWKKIKWQGTGEVDLWALVPKSSPYKKNCFTSCKHLVHCTDWCTHLYCWSSAAYCTAAPLLTVVPLLLCCWCTAGPLSTLMASTSRTYVLLHTFNDWCTAGPMLIYVLLVLCRLLYRCSSAADVLLVL